MHKSKLLMLLAIPALLFSGCGKKNKTENVSQSQQQQQAQMVPIQIRVENGYIQYKTGDEEWSNLLAIEDLKGDPGQPGKPADNESNTIVDAFITNTVDMLSIQREVLHLVMADGTEKTFEFGLKPLDFYYDPDAGSDYCIGYIPVSKDGLPNGKFSYSIYFYDFQGLGSSVSLDFELESSDIFGSVDYTKPGEYSVYYKRFDGELVNGYVQVYYNDDEHLDKFSYLMQYYVPKTSSASEIPDMYAYWKTPNREYHTHKFTAEELEGIDFTTVGEKEITHVFETLYGDQVVLNNKYFTVYDPANITETQSYFDAGDCGADNLDYDVPTKVASIGYAYDSDRQAKNLFHSGAYINYEHSDGKYDKRRLTLDEFVLADVQALRAVNSDCKVNLHFKDNTNCYVEVVCRQESAFSIAQIYTYDYENDIFMTKVNGQYETYLTPNQGFKDVESGAVCFLDLDINDILTNPENKDYFKEGMPASFDNVIYKDGYSVQTYEENWFTVYIYDEIHHVNEIDEIYGPYSDLSIPRDGELPESRFNVDIRTWTEFTIYEDGYTDIAHDYTAYEYDTVILTEKDIVKAKSDLDTNRVGYHDLYFNDPNYGELKSGYFVYDPNIMLYSSYSYMPGDYFELIETGSNPMIIVEYGTPAAQVVSYLEGYYMHIRDIENYESKDILITSDMINADAYDCYRVGFNRVYVYYYGACLPVNVLVESPSWSADKNVLTFADDAAKAAFEYDLYIKLADTDIVYVDDYQRICINSTYVGSYSLVESIDEFSAIVFIELDDGESVYIFTWNEDYTAITLSLLTPEFLGTPTIEGEISSMLYMDDGEMYISIYECGVCKLSYTYGGETETYFYRCVELGNNVFALASYWPILIYNFGTYLVMQYLVS